MDSLFAVRSIILNYKRLRMKYKQTKNFNKKKNEEKEDVENREKKVYDKKPFLLDYSNQIDKKKINRIFHLSRFGLFYRLVQIFFYHSSFSMLVENYTLLSV